METPLGFLNATFEGDMLTRLEVSQTPSNTVPVFLKNELYAYFNGTLHAFQTKIRMKGTPFQMRVWEELQKIPYGETISYTELAIAVGNPKACRAVAQANGANPLLLIVPCHRVINADGKLGGYREGLHRKQWLLTHETSTLLSSGVRRMDPQDKRAHLCR